MCPQLWPTGGEVSIAVPVCAWATPTEEQNLGDRRYPDKGLVSTCSVLAWFMHFYLLFVFKIFSPLFYGLLFTYWIWGPHYWSIHAWGSLVAVLGRPCAILKMDQFSPMQGKSVCSLRSLQLYICTFNDFVP